MREELLTVKKRRENGCYQCKNYKIIKDDPIRSGICKRYYETKNTWIEAIEQCKEDKGV
jgi:hypothetical protein